LLNTNGIVVFVIGAISLVVFGEMVLGIGVVVVRNLLGVVVRLLLVVVSFYSSV